MSNSNNINTSPVTENQEQLVPLENLENWKVHEHDTDIRGWDFYANGEKVGKIENLIASTNQEKVKYVEVELDEKMNEYRDFKYRQHLHQEYHNFYGTDQDRRVIVPIGVVEINNEQKKVVGSPNLNAQHFANSPRYKNWSSTPITPIHEILVAKHYTDNDENYKNDYSGKEYNLAEYRSYPRIPNSRFYQTDLFSRGSYLSRYRNATPSMTNFNSGMPKR